VLKRKGFVGVRDACEEPATARCAMDRRRAVPSYRRASVTAFAMVVVSTPLFVGSDGRRPIEVGSIDRVGRSAGRDEATPGEFPAISGEVSMTVSAGLCRRSSSFGGRVHLRRGTGFTGRAITPLRRPSSAAPAPRGDHRQELLRVKNPSAETLTPRNGFG
jgi:hypothetical protein